MEDADRLEQLQREGYTLFQAKQYEQALEVSNQVVALIDRLHGQDCPEMAVAMLNRGRMHRLLGHDEQCEVDYLQALETSYRHPEGQHQQILWLLRNLSALYTNTGRRAEAEPYQLQLLHLHGVSGAPDDLGIAELLTGVAQTCWERGDAAPALELLRRALAIRARLQGEEHPEVSTLRAAIAGLASQLR